MSKAFHFNTYGGNPLACVAGSAVLDVSCSFSSFQDCFPPLFQANPPPPPLLSVSLALLAIQILEEERCQETAARVGDTFIRGLMSLRDEFEVVGDVRGKGLFLGVELVKDKVSRNINEMVGEVHGNIG